MATFPLLTTSNFKVNQVPISTAPGDYTALINMPLPVAGQDKFGLIYDANGDLTIAPVVYGSDGQQEVDSITSEGIISGLELSVSGGALTVASGRYVLKDSGPEVDEKYSFHFYISQGPISFSNPNGRAFLFVNIDAGGTVTVEEERAFRTRLNLGQIRVEGTTVQRVFSTASRLVGASDQFEQFFNDWGVYQKGITIRITPAGEFVTGGGRIYSGTFVEGVLFPSSTSLSYRKLGCGPSTTGPVLGPVQSGITIDDLKKYCPPGSTEQTLSKNNQYVIWFMFVDYGGELILLQPQEEINPPGQGGITSAELREAYKNAEKTIFLEEDATLVGSITVEGSAGALTDVFIEDLANNPLSSTSGSTTATGTGGDYILPTPDLGRRVRAWNPPVGTFQLASDGTDYKIKKGIQGLTNAGYDGIVRFSTYTDRGPLLDAFEWQNTGVFNKKMEVFYIIGAAQNLFSVDFGARSNLSGFDGLPSNSLSLKSEGAQIRMDVRNSVFDPLLQQNMPGIDNFANLRGQTASEYHTGGNNDKTPQVYVYFIGYLRVRSTNLRPPPDENFTKQPTINTSLLQGDRRYEGRFSSPFAWVCWPLQFTRPDRGGRSLAFFSAKTISPADAQTFTTPFRATPQNDLTDDQKKNIAIRQGDKTPRPGFDLRSGATNAIGEFLEARNYIGINDRLGTYSSSGLSGIFFLYVR